tara:strand:- start:3574 stop:4065 length:492 start_codon:yes stop_codon:yes gene_type:complete
MYNGDFTCGDEEEYEPCENDTDCHIHGEELLCATGRDQKKCCVIQGAFDERINSKENYQLYVPNFDNNLSSPNGQCGGDGWPGSTECTPGYECKKYNEFYSKCEPTSGFLSGENPTTNPIVSKYKLDNNDNDQPSWIQWSIFGMLIAIIIMFMILFVYLKFKN